MSNSENQNKDFAGSAHGAGATAVNKMNILNKGADSTTNVYTTVPMARVVVSVRVRPEVKEALKRYCRANGLSICHIFEGLVIGFLHGVHEQIEFVNKSPTMNVSVVREVRRRRRYAVEDEIETVIEVNDCVECGSSAYAMVTRQDKSRVWLCRVHFDKERPELRSWRVFNEVS
jgi:hypothetical protein